MFIYIDESGTFQHVGSTRNAYSCVGALTIPERFHGQALKSFNRLRRQWQHFDKEVKGRDLDEASIAAVIDVLIEAHAHFHVCVTDMAYADPSVMSARKNDQADRLLAHVTAQHRPAVVQDLQDYREKMRLLPDQLFAQFCVITELVNAHLHDVVIYYAAVDPPELGAFRWVVDRKAHNMTTYEDVWQRLVSPFIQSRQFSSSEKHRIVCVDGGDYTHFERFCGTINNWPSHLPPPKERDVPGQPIEIMRISKILRESFAFGDSASYLGLQLADIVTNAFRRALCGRLAETGWGNLGKLMLRWGDEAVKLVHLGEASAPSITLEDDRVTQVLTQLTDKAQDFEHILMMMDAKTSK